MASPELKTISPEMANRKTIKLSMVPEEQESQLYTLMILKSVFMLSKFVKEWGDSGRKLLIEVKYKLSNCPLTYMMIRDMVTNPSNWNIEPAIMKTQYRFSDKIKNINFTLYNHSTGVHRATYDDYRSKFSKYDPAAIRFYYNSQHEMFNENERVIVTKVLDTHKEMMDNMKEIKRQQAIDSNTNKLKGLY